MFIFCRELAFQISEQFGILGKPIGLKVVVITGGRGKKNILKHLSVSSCEIKHKYQYLVLFLCHKLFPAHHILQPDKSVASTKLF